MPTSFTNFKSTTKPSILMVGHNPGLEDLIFDLVPDDGSSPLRDAVEEKFPTAAYAVLQLAIEDWRDIEETLSNLDTSPESADEQQVAPNESGGRR